MRSVSFTSVKLILCHLNNYSESVYPEISIISGYTYIIYLEIRTQARSLIVNAFYSISKPLYVSNFQISITFPISKS